MRHAGSWYWRFGTREKLPGLGAWVMMPGPLLPVRQSFVFAEANYGDAFRVELTDGIPILLRTQTSRDSLDVVNGVAAPQSTVVDVTLYRDYAPLLNCEVPPNEPQRFA